MKKNDTTKIKIMTHLQKWAATMPLVEETTETRLAQIGLESREPSLLRAETRLEREGHVESREPGC